METEKKERNSFTNSLGFILAAAGSAVGLGNIWRFPYLAAKDGGGLFLLVYLVLSLTFGFTLLITEIAIGRKAQQSPLTAYSRMHDKWGFLGIVAFIVPIMIYPYYCVIGGWVIKYMATYFAFQSQACIADGFFTGFITSQWQPLFFCLLFALACFVIVYKGVEHGIERYSRVFMPLLLIIIIFIAVYVLFIDYTDPNTGVTRTGLQGAAYYFIPNFEGLTFKKFFMIVIDALGQLFFSVSIATGIMVAYGSYMKKSSNLAKSVDRIQIFDTCVGVLAGLMIIPTVFVFAGREGLTASGPALMFISLPKLFAELGSIGDVLGLIFFVMVLFAALTSALSLLEALVSSMIDRFGWSRKKATIFWASLGFLGSIIVCLGYNVFYFEVSFPNGSTGQILDVLDYISNYILMPVVAVLTCILIGWVIKPKKIIKEITRNNEPFRRQGIYVVMIKFIAPILLFFILLTNFGVFDKILK